MCVHRIIILLRYQSLSAYLLIVSRTSSSNHRYWALTHNYNSVIVERRVFYFFRGLWARDVLPLPYAMYSITHLSRVTYSLPPMAAR